MVTLKALVFSLRPKQWTKNLFVYLAFFFTVNLSWDPQHLIRASELFGRATVGFFLFCLLSSSVYLINDLFDLERDRAHPEKRNRPLASGKLSPAIAGATAVLLAVLALVLSFWMDVGFGIVSLIYLGLMLLYDLKLKHQVILDVLTIAGGFVIRAAAGAVAIQVPISPWLYICTALGALFLGFGKRRNELLVMGDSPANHRQTLGEYTPLLLDQMIAVVTPSTLLAYILYTISAQNLPRNDAMLLTVPFVIYGIFRYLYLIHRKNLGGSPEEVLLTDLPLMVDVVLWLVTATVLLLLFRS